MEEENESQGNKREGERNLSESYAKLKREAKTNYRLTEAYFDQGTDRPCNHPLPQ